MAARSDECCMSIPLARQDWQSFDVKDGLKNSLAHKSGLIGYQAMNPVLINGWKQEESLRNIAAAEQDRQWYGANKDFSDS